VLSSWLSGCYSRVCSHLADCRVVGADCPRGAFGPGVLRVLCVFLSAFVSIRLSSGFWWEGVWRTVRPDVTDCPRGTNCSRTVRGRGTDRPRVEVLVGSSCSCLTYRPPWVADRPHGDRGPSAPGPQTVRQGCCTQLSPLLLVLCFRFRQCLGFVPRVGRSVVTMGPWQTRVGICSGEFGV
jgi:hypothetical protein